MKNFQFTFELIDMNFKSEWFHSFTYVKKSNKVSIIFFSFLHRKPTCSEGQQLYKIANQNVAQPFSWIRFYKCLRISLS